MVRNDASPRSMSAKAALTAIAVVLSSNAMVPYAFAGEATAAPAPPQPRDEVSTGAPNVLLWMLDDVGFAQLSCFGGLVATPNIDRVASMGLRYANYRTPAICSASRAAILSGRNPHTVHLGSHAAAARPQPGYDGRIPASAGSIAANLKQAGYRTFALGKWDHLPTSQASPAGPYNQWPAGQGFDHFYGFLAADADNFNPILIRDTSPIKRPAGDDYHLNNDLADQAMAMIDKRDAAGPLAPFFMYWATGTAHAPHHAPQEWIDRYRGRFDMGWDKAREQILKQQISEGLLPKGTKLAPRPEGMPAWTDLNAEQKKLYSRQMEVFAASLSHADEQFGRILDKLEERGELENTMVIVTADNGASAEGGPRGLYNEAFLINGNYPSDDVNMQFYDRWGGPETYPHYAVGWAVAGNTPFRYYKQVTHDGGVHVPLVVSWPKGIAARGELRHQPIHVADIGPTVLEAAGAPLAEMVNNVKQQPMDGISFSYSYTAPDAASPRKAQYYELHGNKALVAGDWSINTTHSVTTWQTKGAGKVDEPWELYNIARDPGQTTDLAARQPERVAELAEIFEEQAKRYNVYPLGDISGGIAESMRQAADDIMRRRGKWTFDGPVGNIPAMVAPPVSAMGFQLSAQLDLPASGVTGPVFASGGQMGGFALYLRDSVPVVILNSISGETTEFAAPKALSGKTSLGLTFTNSGEMGFGPPKGSSDHEVTITADGKELAKGTISFDMPRSFGISEVFGVGIDNGSTVMAGAEADVSLAAGLSDVTIQLMMPH